MSIEWRVEKRKVAELKTWERNPRKITEEAFLKLKSRIEKRGFHDVIKIDTDGNILSGNQRKRALAELGIEEVDCKIPNRELTENEKKEICLESNRNDGAWDFDMLGNEYDMEMLTDIGFTEKELGFDFGQPDEKDDEVPEVPPEPVAKMGEIYQLGGHRIMCGDSTKREDVEKLMGGIRADMVFTDPPYALFGNSTGVAGITDDKMTRPFFLEIFRAMKRSTKLFSHLYTCCDWHSAFSLQNMAREIELKEKNLCIWDKGDGGIGGAYQNCYEMIWFHSNSPLSNKTTTGAVRSGERPVNGRPNIWRYKRESNNRIHNAQKPVELIINAIKNSSDGFDIVLDLFLGSGSTLIACEKTNRICYGMEIDPRYIDVIITRWEKFTGKKAEKVS